MKNIKENFDPIIDIKVDYKDAEEIKSRYQLFKKQNPKSRIRDIADELNLSEGEIIASMIGETSTRLENNFEEILKSIVDLGEVMALTRNEACVHERHGVYENAEFSTHGKMKHGLFANPDIDLRLFMSHWKHVFAVQEESRGVLRKSIQFFDKSGSALHKIYLTANSNEKAYDRLVEKFKSQNQDKLIETEEYEPKKKDLDDSEIDWKALRNSWENLQDTHDFYIMLKKHKVGRVQSFKNIGEDFAYEVKNDSAQKMLEMAAQKNCEIMVFVGNRGMIQIHTGEVKKLFEMKSWYNVMDPKFNLHLNRDLVHSSWVVKKPTVDGIVTALELFDENGEIIVTFFGKRKPGIPELELWREIVDQIEKK